MSEIKRRLQLALVSAYDLFGTAMLAGMAFKADIEKWNNVQQLINPVEEWIEPYKKGVQYYRKLYTALKELMSQTRKFER